MSLEDHQAGLRWEMMGQESSGPQLHSLKLLLQETSAFKQQNPGKFCLLVCSLCTFLAVLGRYIPGIVISYALVLGFFLWPLVSFHEIGLWLEPVLQKLDFGLGDFLQKIRDSHEKRLSQAQAQTQGAESDLSSMFPKLDSSVCKEMCVSDTEVSDVTWTDGTFNLSEGHTPLTEDSEELDKEEFTSHLPEFPSVGNGNSTNGDEEDDLYLPVYTPEQPITSQHTDGLSELGNQLVAAVIQERIEAALGLTDSGLQLPQCTGVLEESDSDMEDFELLDQSELEQFETELGLVQEKVEEQNKGHKQTAVGFLSKLLRRQ